MTREHIEDNLSSYKDKYITDNALQKIEDTLYDYELEFGNIVCMFNYQTEKGLELSFLTCPSTSMPRVILPRK